MLNKATLIGNVGADPEIKSLQSGDKVANISLATSERWKDKQTGERKEKTEWHRVVIFGKLAEVVEKYVTKGSKLYIEGKIQTRSWEQEGVKKYTTEIILNGLGDTMVMLDSKGGDVKPSAHDQAKADGYQPQPDEADEIPFD